MRGFNPLVSFQRHGYNATLRPEVISSPSAPCWHFAVFSAYLLGLLPHVSPADHDLEHLRGALSAHNGLRLAPMRKAPGTICNTSIGVPHGLQA